MKKLISISIIAMAMLISCSGGDRYDIVTIKSMYDGTQTFMIDKKNGTLWQYRRYGWENIGSPPIDAPNDGDYLKF